MIKKQERNQRGKQKLFVYLGILKPSQIFKSKTISIEMNMIFFLLGICQYLNSEWSQVTIPIYNSIDLQKSWR